MQPYSAPRLATAMIGGTAAVGGFAVALWALGAAWSVPGLEHAPDLPFVLVVALVLAGLGAAFTTPFRNSACWASLALVGHATSLRMVDAGTAVLYQHLRPAVSALSPSDWLILDALGISTLLVAAGLTPFTSPIRRWVGDEMGTWRMGAVLVAWAALSASPLRDLGGFVLEIGLSTTLSLVWLGAILLACLGLPAGFAEKASSHLERLIGGTGKVGPFDVVALACAAAVTLVSSGLVLWAWERHPHLSDEISFLFQATYFADGALAAPGVPVPELFAAYQIECSAERCISVLQPGWPALLSLGVLVGLPWLVNPILAGANTLLFHALARELYGNRLARVAAILIACSPWHLFLGMSFMNHQATLLGGLLGVLGTTLAIRGARPGWALLAGAGAGLTSLMRPMDGVVIAAVAGGPLLFAGAWPRRLTASALFALGTALFGSLNLVYNFALTGHPLEFPVTSYVNALWGEGTNNLGFGPDRGIYPLWAHMDGFPGHSPFQAVVNATLNATALQVELFGWAVGSFLPLLLLLAWGRLRRPDWLLLGWIAAINLLYGLYWFASGPDFAARYWFLAVVPLAMLSARGLRETMARLDARAPKRGRVAGAFAVALLLAQALLVFIPWRATDKYYRYFNTGPHVREALESGVWPAGVYIVRGANQPDYAAAMIYAAPDLPGGEHVFVSDSLPDTPERIGEAYRQAKVFWLDGPSLTQDGYRVYSRHDPTQ